MPKKAKVFCWVCIQRKFNKNPHLCLSSSWCVEIKCSSFPLVPFLETFGPDYLSSLAFIGIFFNGNGRGLIQLIYGNSYKAQASVLWFNVVKVTFEGFGSRENRGSEEFWG